MLHKNLMITLASLLLVLSVLLAPGFISSTAHANSKVNAASGCPMLQEWDGYDNSKTAMHNVAVLQTWLFHWFPKFDAKFDYGYSNTNPYTNIDGYFGPGTLRLVVEVQTHAKATYQKYSQIGIDGMVGPDTWGVLMADLTNPKDPKPGSWGNCTNFGPPSDEILPAGL